MLGIDHIGYHVRDFGSSDAFYRAALKPLGYSFDQAGDNWAMPAKEGRPLFWYGEGGESAGQVHVAFTAATHAEVRAFYKAALLAGGRDNGAPGLRPHYHPNYYAAFVFDPDGNNIEAVCHAPGDAADQHEVG